MGTWPVIRPVAPGEESPWYNHFLVRALPPMTTAEVRAYLEDRLGAPWSLSSEIPGLINELSGGRPLLVWHFAYVMVEEALLARTTRLRAAQVFAAVDTVKGMVREELVSDLTTEGDYAAALARVAALREEYRTLYNQLTSSSGPDGAL